jgi:hypothetical protein
LATCNTAIELKPAIRISTVTISIIGLYFIIPTMFLLLVFVCRDAGGTMIKESILLNNGYAGGVLFEFHFQRYVFKRNRTSLVNVFNHADQ